MFSFQPNVRYSAGKSRGDREDMPVRAYLICNITNIYFNFNINLLSLDIRMHLLSFVVVSNFYVKIVIITSNTKDCI